MPKKAITAPGATTAGPYSHAIKSGEKVYFPVKTNRPETGELIKGVLANKRGNVSRTYLVLENAGLTPDDVVKVNVYLTNMDDFSEMNSVYQEQFSQPYPARTTVGIDSLPLGAEIEIEMIARKHK